MKKILTIAGFLFILSVNGYAQGTAGTNAADQQAVVVPAQVQAVEGVVNVLDEEMEWSSVQKGAKISEGSQITVGSASKAVIKIGDNVVTLTEGALINLKSISNECLLKLWQGKITAKVKKLKDNKSFKVQTPVAVCAVRGTEFDVQVAGNNATTLKTHKGLVAFTDSATGIAILVKPGYQAVIEPGSKPQLSPIQSKIDTDVQEDAGVEEAEQAVVRGAKHAAMQVADDQQDTEKTEKKKKKKKKKQSASKSSGVGLDMNGSFGADVLVDSDNPENKQIYYNLSLLPEISFWKIGVGLDISLYFDEEGNIREDDWDDWNDVASKIWYVRYGQKEDSLYALIGGIRNYSLGHGFILNNYTNMLEYPSVRNIGFVGRVNFTKMGFETIISNIDSYPLVGGRFFYRPLATSGMPLIKNLTFGVTGVTDQNPDMMDSTGGDEITYYGADCELPLVDKFTIKSMAYVDYASYQLGSSYNNVDDPGYGTACGLGGSVFEKFKYSFEYRKLDNNFVPRYFDTFYEVDRSSKAVTMTASKDPYVEGPYFMAGIDLLSKASLLFTYEDYNIDTQNRYPYLHGALNIDPAVLMNKMSLNISYDKKNVENINDVTELEGAIMTTEIGYMVGNNIMMVMVQKQTFNEEGDSTRTMSMHTRIKF
jgi:hypothetical protein